MRILFICAGNTCRSQIAEALARDVGHEACSAGTSPGEVVSKNAIRVLEELGVDSSGLAPKSIDSIDTNRFDKTISMGCGVECPNLPIDEDWGLEDPHGMDLEFFRGVCYEIKQNILGLIRGTDA